MKKLLIFVLFFYNSVYSQTNFSNRYSGNPADYFKSNFNELKDLNGVNISNNLSQTDSIVLSGENSGNEFGRSVSSAGDVNGDGFTDFIVGAYGYNSYTGKVYIFFGGVNINNIADIILTGEDYENLFGYSVSTAGDVNGDGFSDVIIGAHGYNYPTGRAYIFFGGTSMNNIADVVLTGESGGYFGESVSTAGDVNGDGFSDVIVGSPGLGNLGRAYIFYGGSSMNSIADIVMTGEMANSDFGASVSAAGDLNGDGYADIIIGAYGYQSGTGRAYLYYGSSSMNNLPDVIISGETQGSLFGNSVSYAGDLNGDGFSDVIIGSKGLVNFTGRAYIFFGGSSMNNIADVILDGQSVNNYFGFSVAFAGDVNTDGFSDVIVGSPNFDNNTGRSYVYYGSNYMNSVADLIMTGENIGDRFGISVSSAGDVNGDENSDLVIGASHTNNLKGKSYLFVNLMTIPKLIFPTNNSTNNLTLINFKWRKLNSAEYYILKISLDSVFENVILSDTILIDTFKTISIFQKGNKYFWKITAQDSSGIVYNSSTWSFSTIPPLIINIKILLEGFYYPIFNMMTRKDTVRVYLRNITSPYNLIDSSIGKIDSITFSNIFTFKNAPSGTYYIVVKHFNCIETWSKVGGESIIIDATIYNYNFTTSNSQSLGNNMKRKGTKYCLFSGNVNDDFIIDASDISSVENDVSGGVEGFVRTDLNGDYFVDSDDLSIIENNIGVLVVTP